MTLGRRGATRGANVELCSLHPISDALAAAYVQQLTNSSLSISERPDHEATGLTSGGAIGVNGFTQPNIGDRQIQQIGFGLAQFLALEHPVYAGQSLALTSWEARVDLGIAMMIRPPSRLFTDAGLPARIARMMPIRLDLGEGMMGGAYIPARLMPQVHELVSRNLKRSVRRMIDADMDATTLQGLMMEAVEYAATNELGLFEAIGLVDFSEPATWPPGIRVHNRPSDKGVVQRVALAAKPEPKPGAISRVWKTLTRG